MVPGRYREVREAYRKHFHLISSESELMARSYDQKTIFIAKPKKKLRIYDYTGIPAIKRVDALI